MTGLVLVPAFGGATFLPALLPVFALIILLILIGCVVDVMLSRRALKRVRVETTDVIHATVGREVEIPLSFSDPSGAASRIRGGLEFGDAFHSENPLLDIKLPGGNAKVSHRWAVTALKRGKYEFAQIHLETSSQFGLWEIRRSADLRLEVRVYPDLRSERHGLAAIFLRRGGLGLQPRPQLGKGREFEHLREYVPGDDYADIYWKGTARRGFPTTKMFQVERTQEVYVVIDHSRLSSREIRVPVPTLPGAIREEEFHAGGEFLVTTQLEKYLQGALVMGTVAEQQLDLFGLITFSDQVGQFIRSKNGRKHFDSCRDAIYALQPEFVSPNYDELAVFVRNRLTRRALIIILTDLSDPVSAESFCESIQLVSRQHVVIVNMIRPDSVKPLFADEEVATTRDLYENLSGHFHWTELQELERKLHNLGVQFTLPDSGALTLDLVNQYMRIKSRQLL